MTYRISFKPRYSDPEQMGTLIYWGQYGWCLHQLEGLTTFRKRWSPFLFPGSHLCLMHCCRVNSFLIPLEWVPDAFHSALQRLLSVSSCLSPSGYGLRSLPTVSWRPLVLPRLPPPSPKHLCPWNVLSSVKPDKSTANGHILIHSFDKHLWIIH